MCYASGCENVWFCYSEKSEAMITKRLDSTPYFRFRKSFSLNCVCILYTKSIHRLSVSFVLLLFFCKYFAVGVFFCLQLTIDDTIVMSQSFHWKYANETRLLAKIAMDAIGYFIHNNKYLHLCLNYTIWMAKLVYHKMWTRHIGMVYAK